MTQLLTAGKKRDKSKTLALPTPLSVARNAPDTDFSFNDAFPQNGVVVVMGDRGQGKTAMAYYVMHERHKRSNGKIGGAVFLAPDGLKALLPGWIAKPQQLMQIPPDSVVVIDEAQQVAHARRAMADTNLELANLVALSRQRNQLIFIITHHSRKLDLLNLMDASRVIWKKPLASHVMMERKEIKPFTARAFHAFETLTGDSRKWAYVMDSQNLRFGFVKSKLAPWWTEQMSTGLAELGQPDGNPGKKKRKKRKGGDS